MNTELKNALAAANREAQYDACAKRLLGQKCILAHILVNTVEEFYGMNPKDVVDYIEGTPYIGTVPVEPGLTNKEAPVENQAVSVEKTTAEVDAGGQNNLMRTEGVPAFATEKQPRIVGWNTENQELGEGLIRFDIVFYVRRKNGLSQIIVNVEAQKDEPDSYDILNRTVFYGSRLISSQKERDFVKSHYNDIRQVYSIWICMNMPENSINHIHFTDDALLGNYQWKGNLDLLNIVMVGLAKQIPAQEERYTLHRLLGVLLSQKLEADEKLEIMEREYDIPAEEEIREEVNIMCNLSQGIKEEGIAIGESRGEARGMMAGRAKAENRIIHNMYKNGFSVNQIAAVTEKDAKTVEAILLENTYS